MGLGIVIKGISLNWFLKTKRMKYHKRNLRKLDKQGEKGWLVKERQAVVFIECYQTCQITLFLGRRVEGDQNRFLGTLFYALWHVLWRRQFTFPSINDLFYGSSHTKKPWQLKQNCLKGQSHEIFHFRFFKLNKSIWGPDTPPKIFSNFVSNSPSYSNLKFDSPLYNIAGSR